MWMINITKILAGETAIKLLLIVMMKKKKLQFQKKNFTQLKSEIKYCVMYRSANQVVTVELNEHWKDAGDKYDN